MKVSIIIASYKNSDNLKKCLSHCLQLDYLDYEIVVAGSIPPLMNDPRIVWLHVSEESQGNKRNAAIRVARGELCAFIDDDAYPRPDWLANAVRVFEDQSVGAVCGPGVAPSNEDMLERGSSAVLASFMATGPARCRYVPCSRRLVFDVAYGCNLFVRRALLVAVGGFPVGLRAAEDALLSVEIRKRGWKIVYVPSVVVFHRRRSLFVPLMRQIGNYGLHRGFLLKKHRELRNPLFMLFPLVVLYAFMVGLPLLIVFPSLVLVLVGIYLLDTFASGLLESRSVVVALLAMLGIPLIHLAYVAMFFKGLLSRRLKETPSY